MKQKNKMRALRFFLITALLLAAFGLVQEPRIDHFLSAPVHDGIVLTPDPTDSTVWKSESMTLPQGKPCAISITVNGGGTLDVFFETPSGTTTRHLHIFDVPSPPEWRAVLPAPSSSCRLVLKQIGTLSTKPVFEHLEVQNVDPRYYHFRTAVRAFRICAVALVIAALLWEGWLARFLLMAGITYLIHGIGRLIAGIPYVIRSIGRLIGIGFAYGPHLYGLSIIFFLHFMGRLPSWITAPEHRWRKIALSLIVGVLVGIVFDYCLYRFLLPAKPFVYVSF